MKRSALPHHDGGAALLSTLFLVLLMSVAALAATEALGRTVAVSRRFDAGAEAAWSARSAALAGEILLTEFDKTKAPLPRQPMPFQLATGALSAAFSDGGNCFNLNGLVGADAGAGLNAGQLEAYHRLLTAIGFTENDAEALSATLADWIDADSSTRALGAEDQVYLARTAPHRAANAPLMSASELRAIDGYDTDVVLKILPYVCAEKPTDVMRLNLNTLAPERAALLTAMFSPRLEPETAMRLIEARPAGGWLSVDDFLKDEAIAAIAPEARRDAALVLVTDRVNAQLTLAGPDGSRVYTATYQRLGTGGFRLLRFSSGS
jgi:general secretion pathway protein K